MTVVPARGPWVEGASRLEGRAEGRAALVPHWHRQASCGTASDTRRAIAHSNPTGHEYSSTGGGARRIIVNPTTPWRSVGVDAEQLGHQLRVLELILDELARRGLVTPAEHGRHRC